MESLRLGTVSRNGESRYHHWDVDGGHLDVSYSHYHLASREPWIDRFLSASGVELVLGGPYARKLREARDPLLIALRYTSPRAAGAIQYVERLVTRRIRDGGSATGWGERRTVLVIDRADLLGEPDVCRLARLVRVGEPLGVSVVIFRAWVAGPMMEAVRNEMAIGHLRLGLLLRDRYSEEAAPNQRAAVYQPRRGRKVSFVLTHESQAP